MTETAVAGWDLTGLTCAGDDDSSVTPLSDRKATLDIEAGENVTCTFKNTKHASLTVVKETDPATDPQDFDFDLTGTGIGTDLDLDTDPASATPSQQTFSLNASQLGAKTVTETAVAGWDLTGLTCAGDDDSSVTPRAIARRPSTSRRART